MPCSNILHCSRPIQDKLALAISICASDFQSTCLHVTFLSVCLSARPAHIMHILCSTEQRPDDKRANYEKHIRPTHAQQISYQFVSDDSLMTSSYADFSSVPNRNSPTYSLISTVRALNFRLKRMWEQNSMQSTSACILLDYGKQT